MAELVPGRKERGSALIVVSFAALVLVLVATSHLLLTQTESRISANEEHASRARHAAAAVARAIRLWFEQPATAPGFPAPDAFERDRERIDPSDPYAAEPIREGPQYKEGIDLDGDGRDDLLAWPYGGAAVHTFLGSERAPDLLLVREDVLAAISKRLLGDGAGSRSPVRLRIAEIAMYAPPYSRAGANWVRQGVATIKVVVAVERRLDGVATLLARRTARVVLERLPYGDALIGPVHSCGDVRSTGALGVRWGAVVAAGDIVLDDAVRVPPSFPRALPDETGGDRLWTADPDWVSEFSAALAPGVAIQDPWLRLIAKGAISGAPSDLEQPWSAKPPPPPGSPPPWDCCDRSNRIQRQGWLRCPSFDHGFWKRAARSGLPGAHYFSWADSDRFREEGVGPPKTLSSIFAEADGEAGIWFFDTADGEAPRDEDGDGLYDNLTPPIDLGEGWAGRGAVFLHSRRTIVRATTHSLAESIRAPGELQVDNGGGWIDLRYPADLERPFLPGAAGIADAAGPPFPRDVQFRGLLVSSGALELRGAGILYGAVVAHSIVLDPGDSTATGVVWDADLPERWPPSEWRIPRFAPIRERVD